MTDARDEIVEGLLAACKALLPYAESARVPGPAMSDPWRPPEEVIRRAREAIARATAGAAEAGVRMCDGCGEGRPRGDGRGWSADHSGGWTTNFCPACTRARAAD